jgi:hypothetical protein
MAIGLGQSTPRLGIPKVNQNPKPPTMKAALGNRIVAPQRGAKAKAFGTAIRAAAPKSTATGPSAALQQAAAGIASTNFSGVTGSTSAAAAETPAAPAPVNTNPFAIPTYTPTNGQPDPRDAEYWANLSKLAFNDQTEYSKDLQEQTVADSSYSSALQQAIQGRKVQERNLGENAISHNLSSSGYLDRTEGEQTRDYTQERANAALTKSQEDQARETARKALVEGFNIEAAAELAAAAGRYAEGQGKEAETGSPEYTPASWATKPAANPKGWGSKFSPAAKEALVKALQKNKKGK